MARLKDDFYYNSSFSCSKHIKKLWISSGIFNIFFKSIHSFWVLDLKKINLVIFVITFLLRNQWNYCKIYKLPKFTYQGEKMEQLILCYALYVNMKIQSVQKLMTCPTFCFLLYEVWEQNYEEKNFVTLFLILYLYWFL